MGVPGDGKANVRRQVSPSDLSEDRGWPAVAVGPLTFAFVTKSGERSIAEYGTDFGNADKIAARMAAKQTSFFIDNCIKIF